MRRFDRDDPRAIAPFGTHFPYLAGIVCRTEGPVLELGAGHYSTPMLHAICAGRRPLVTLDTDPAWVAHFEDLNRHGHEIRVVEDFNILPNLNDFGAGYWGVVFVDHAHDDARAQTIAQVQRISRFVVVHDTERQGYRAPMDAYKYGRNFTTYNPHTTIVSDFWEIPEEIA